jgi:protoheme IX farnesyltransferase
MAIAWLYRDDYGKAGFPMLPVVDPKGRRAGRYAVFFAGALLPISVAPITGAMWFTIALVLGFGLLALAMRFAWVRNDSTARELFFGSITYLPLLWAVLIIDKV